MAVKKADAKKSRKTSSKTPVNEIKTGSTKTGPVKTDPITNYFPIRRSARKVALNQKQAQKTATEEQIVNGTNEKNFVVEKFENKGRGVKTLINIKKGEFVLEYKGELMNFADAKEREKEYTKNPTIGSYMYFFQYKGVNYCVDATLETPYLGRLVNHSIKPNCKTKVVEIDGQIYLCLFAIRDIEIGEELLYDYGDHSAKAVAANPWLLQA